jgi:hypothetical protein
LLGLAALYRRRRWAFGLALVGGLLLLLQSLPLVGSALMGTLETGRRLAAGYEPGRRPSSSSAAA